MVCPRTTRSLLLALLASGCESAPVIEDAPDQSIAQQASSPPSPSAVAQHGKGTNTPLDPVPPVTAKPVMPEPPMPAPIVSAFEECGPPAPPPRPSIQATLSDFDAAASATEVVLRATLGGTATGEGELPPSALHVGVTLTGPMQRPLLAKTGDALLVMLAPTEATPLRAGPITLVLEGRLSVADLSLLGAGLHQVIPELTIADADGLALNALEQFPYLWVTRTDSGNDGINDARVVAPK